MGGFLFIFVPFLRVGGFFGGVFLGCFFFCRSRTDWHPQWEQSAGIVEVEKSSRPFYSGLAAAATWRKQL